MLTFKLGDTFIHAVRNDFGIWEVESVELNDGKADYQKLTEEQMGAVIACAISDSLAENADSKLYAIAVEATAEWKTRPIP